MLSSFHNTGWWRLACIALAVLTPREGGAQQIVFAPRVETTAEWDTNPLLRANRNESAEWFQALFSGDWRRLGPRSDLEFRPQVTLQNSTIKTLDKYEALVNLRGDYLTQRGGYNLVAEYHRQDAYNAEYGIAAFNPLNPNAPATVGSGFIVTGVTRQSFQISPSVEHSFTQRFQGEADATLLAVRYSIQIPETLVSFNAPSFGVNGVWAVSQRGQLAVGPFYSEYDPTDARAEGVLKSRSYGASVSYRYQTTNLTSSQLRLKLGRDEQYQNDGSRSGTNTWGLEWKGTYKLQTSQLQFVLGRLLEPSGVGGEIALYQIRVQYTREFSATLKGEIAGRATRQQGVGAEKDLLTTRNRGYGQASLTKLLSRDFFLTGGYRFLAQKLNPNQRLAQDHGVFLTIGWQPLEPR